MKKEWTKEEIKEILKSDDAAVCRGILAIYKRQTFDEQATEHTHYHNGIGFNGVDAKLLSSFAKQIIKWMANKKYKRPLSDNQMPYARKKIMKYVGQLTSIANDN